jgi:hypothetical protein
LLEFPTFLETMLQTVPLSTEDLEFKSPIEWEERQEGFFLENFWLTLKRSLLAPLKFFENLRRDGSYIRPLLYAILAEFLTAAISSLVWGGLFAGFAFGGTGHWGVLGANFQIFTLLLGLVFLIAGLWISSIIYYCAALILGARSGFRTLFRMYVYTEGTVVFRLIPVIGTAVTEIYRLVLLYFGFRKVYRFNEVRALLAVLIPALILLALALMMNSFSLYYLLKS